jgi:hypothetical protein
VSSEAHFGPFGDSEILGARLVHGFVLNVPWAWKSFKAHLTVLLGDFGQVKARFGPFGDSTNLDGR